MLQEIVNLLKYNFIFKVLYLYLLEDKFYLNITLCLEFYNCFKWYSLIINFKIDINQRHRLIN